MNKTSSKLQADLKKAVERKKVVEQKKATERMQIAERKKADELKKTEKHFQNENLYPHKELVDYAELGKPNAKLWFLICFKNRNGKLNTCIISSVDLLNSRTTQAILVSNGFPFMTSKDFYEYYEYLMVREALPIGYITQTPGWHSLDAKMHYVYPQENHALPIIYLPSPSVKLGANIEIGNLEDWQEIIKVCALSTRARLAVAMAFAGIILRLVDEPSWGIFLYGKTSRGKTFCQILASSVAGNVDESGVPSFSSTIVALEQYMRGANDCCLTLDEFGAQGLSGKDVETFMKKYIYTFLNGNNRQLSGNTQATYKFVPKPTRSTLIISSEEPYVQSFDGQGVRLMQLNAIPKGRTDIYDYPDDTIIGDTVAKRGAIVNDFIQRLKQHQGVAKREFLIRLQQDMEGAKESLASYRIDFQNALTEKGLIRTSEDGRRAKALSTAYAAAALAIDYGILPWDKDTTLDDLEICFKDICSFSSSAFSKSDVERMSEADLIDALRKVRNKLNPLKIEAKNPPSEEDIESAKAYRLLRPKASIKQVVCIKPEAWRELVPEFLLSSALLDMLSSKGILLKGSDDANTAQIHNEIIAPKRKRFYVLDEKAFLSLTKKGVKAE